MTFTRADFVEIEGKAADSLIKTAANQELNKLSGQQKVNLSIKHQVLCDATAIIGVMKQTDKASGQLQEKTIKFSKEALPEPENTFAPFKMSFGKGFGGGSAASYGSAVSKPMTFGFGGSAVGSSNMPRMGGFGGSAMSSAKPRGIGGFGGSAMSSN